MIVVHGSVVVWDGAVDEAIGLSLEHVRRSRAEPGCIAHGVHRDCENPNRLVFVEEWVDRAALEQHFQVPASRRFVAELVALSVEAPIIQIYEAARLEHQR
jgi:quinol monooxygenase YgiN